MKVLWIFYTGQPGLMHELSALRSSPSAAVRLRVAIPAAELARRQIRQAALCGPPRQESLNAALAWSADVVVLSKFLPPVSEDGPAPQYLKVARALKEAGARIVLDVADNYLADDRASDFLALTGVADFMVANTVMMADEIREQTRIAALVIGDPVEGARQAPRWEAKRRGLLDRILNRRAASPVRLLWFGGQGRNYRYLLEWLPHLAALGLKTPVELHVVFAPLPAIEAEIASLDRKYRPQLSIHFSAWSRETLQIALGRCDLVLLPTDATSAARIGASPNRLTESLWAGRFVVASGLASYWEFKDCAWIGEDLIEGLEWALEHPNTVRARIARGQSLIADRYSPEAIGNCWYDALHEVIHAWRPAAGSRRIPE